jgi:hypothetical protein
MLNKPRKIFASIGGKAIICLVCLAVCVASVSFALVTYTSSVTITPIVQLSVGTTTSSWTVYQNEQNIAQYMPGGTNEPTLSAGDTSTYAFEVVTDASKVCAVEVQLTSAMDASQFSNFDITVLSSSGTAWSTATLYTSATGTTSTSSIDGLTQGAAAYIHQSFSLTMYYEIQVTYSYIGNTSPITATFQFTPLPENGF